MYVAKAIEPPVRRGQDPNKPRQMRQIIVGQFPLNFDLLTGEFALAGTRLTAEQWLELREAVDRFMVKHHMMEILEVHDLRPSMSKRAGAVVKWLTRG